MSRRLTRREFLGEASCASVGSVAALSAMLNLNLVSRAASVSSTSGRKTIVNVMLAGGMDSFNFLVRKDTAGYNEYATSRSDMSLPLASLIGLNYTAPVTVPAHPMDGMEFGLHASCPELADLFNGTGSHFTGKRRLSFVANIGTLVRPTTMGEYDGGNAILPKALFSHIDQIHQWQTSVPQGLPELKGWAGRMADVLHSTQNSGASSMSISLAGNNVFQIGENTSQFAITRNGALLPSGDPAGTGSQSARKNQALDSFVAQTYGNMMQDALARHTKNSLDAQKTFEGFYSLIDDSEVKDWFPDSKFGDELLAAAKTIRIRNDLGLNRSTIFIQRGGWDHHGELLNTQAGMLTDLSQGLYAFQRALEHWGLQDDVITFTSSDFGRTLRSNGRGTDHAWGGNAMVMGGPVEGGNVFGTFPSLALDGADDVGKGGRFLPSTSVDVFFAEMAKWFGVSNADMPYVLPNLHEFVNIGTTPQPLGFVKPGLIS